MTWKDSTLYAAGALLLATTIATAKEAWTDSERCAALEARSSVLEKGNDEAHGRIERKLEIIDSKLDRIKDR